MSLAGVRVRLAAASLPVFPTILFSGDLLRLALNVTSTRVMLHGQDGRTATHDRSQALR